MTETASPKSQQNTLSPLERWLFFDRQDHTLLQIVNDVLERRAHDAWKKVLAPYLHPNGIKEMASTFGLRVAYSVINVLGSLETGKAEERLAALRSLRDEVLLAPQSSLQYNTSRVLVQIMKELVRAKGDYLQQLRLAHDFRRCIMGKPRIIRAQLDKYRLLEMREDYGQLAFDDHVHDAYSKGRKTPSHLVMDAWIKGLRKVTLVYYNHVPENVAYEVLEAANIMNISVRICVEMRARHLGRYVKLLWTPRGFQDSSDFVGFLKNPAVRSLMEKGRNVSEYQRKYVWRLIDKYDKTIRCEIAEETGVDVPELDRGLFAEQLGPGQPSVDQLAHQISLMLRERSDKNLDPEYIITRWLSPEVNPEIHNPYAVSDEESVPESLRLTPAALTSLLGEIHYHNWIALDPEGLNISDIILVLYACSGSITHLETFNYKEYTKGKWPLYQKVMELQSVLNASNAIRCKRLLNKCLRELEDCDAPEDQRKRTLLGTVRENLTALAELYRKRPLRSRVGTDSTGHSRLRHGMGIVVAETLPPGARAKLRSSRRPCFDALPISLDVAQQITYRPRNSESKKGILPQIIPGLPFLGNLVKHCWVKGGYKISQPGKSNLYALGGGRRSPTEEPDKASQTKKGLECWSNLNSKLRNGLKILMGLLPAALSFYFTKDWWLLAWFGALIWFFITGLRNIIQSVLGCGGIRRSRFLRWKDLVSWDRFSDSLLFTGFSVPLLDWLVKAVVLDSGLDINTTTNPLLLYAVMALVNGMYISGHNILRGLPRSAVIGNFFRSILSIPLAFLFNAVAGQLLLAAEVPGVEAILQKWAAIISKFASDCVAAVIEGLADRNKYIALRKRDVDQKLDQILTVHAQLEALYPRDDVLELLEMTEAFIETISTEQKGLERIVIVNALDFLYLWMYQPRTRSVVARTLKTLSPEERRAFLLSQYVLQREKEISLLLVNGLIGRNFGPALAFYLANYRDYLDQIQRMALKN